MTAAREQNQQTANALKHVLEDTLSDNQNYVLIVFNVDASGEMHVGVTGRGHMQHAAIASEGARKMFLSGLPQDKEVTMDVNVVRKSESSES